MWNSLINIALCIKNLVMDQFILSNTPPISEPSLKSSPYALAQACMPHNTLFIDILTSISTFKNTAYQQNT